MTRYPNFTTFFSINPKQIIQLISMKRRMLTRDEFMHEKNSIELVFCINAMYFLQVDVKVMQFFYKVIQW